jgi:hypothetical protein
MILRRLRLSSKPLLISPSHSIWQCTLLRLAYHPSTALWSYPCLILQASSVRGYTVPRPCILKICTVGQIIFGHVCDIAPYAYVVIASGSGAALSAYLLWGFAHSLGPIFAFVVVFGSLVCKTPHKVPSIKLTDQFQSGGFGSVWPAASVEIAGPEQSSVSSIFGFFSMTKGVAAVIGPLIAAALHHPEQAAMRSTYSGYGFRDVTLFVGSMMVATAAGGLATRLAKRVY